MGKLPLGVLTKKRNGLLDSFDESIEIAGLFFSEGGWRGEIHREEESGGYARMDEWDSCQSGVGLVAGAYEVGLQPTNLFETLSHGASPHAGMRRNFGPLTFMKKPSKGFPLGGTHDVWGIRICSRVERRLA